MRSEDKQLAIDITQIKVTYMNCVIIDDDNYSLNVTKHCVTITEGLQLLADFSDPVSAYNYIRQNQSNIDLVFLDVEMPGMSGIELLASIPNFPPVILVSAKENYAIKAFEYQVIDYLLKPIDYGKFLKSLARVFRATESNKGQSFEYLFVKENGVNTKLTYNDIHYFEALGDYIKVHTKDKVFVINSTMKSIESKLQQSENFARVHRSFFVNLKYLEKFDAEVAIVANKPIAIGGKYKAELQNRLLII